MREIGEKMRRAFKTAAGLDPAAPLTSPVVAMYAVLFLSAVWLLLAWLLGASE
jgi:hypothetical protein